MFSGKLAAQVVGQSIPAGVLFTAPDPTPAKATVNPFPMVNVAPTVVAAVMVKVHAFVPEQLPCQPVKKYPVPAVAVSAIFVPLVKFALQVPGQLIPSGLLTTVPEPESGGVIVN